MPLDNTEELKLSTRSTTKISDPLKISNVGLDDMLSF